MRIDVETSSEGGKLTSGGASTPSRRGILEGVGAYVLWGLLPIYWKLLEPIPAVEILAHRIVWSMVFLLVIVAFRQRSRWWAVLRNPRIVATFVGSSMLLAVNWGIYIWAVTHDQIVATSLGYFIAPLAMAGMGIVFLGEQLDRPRLIALSLAGLGVIWLTFLYGSFPWIALSLAGTWSVYSLIRKVASLGSLHGLLLETVVLTPVAAIYLAMLHRDSSGAFALSGFTTTALLIGAGVATSVPLLLFASAARRVTMFAVGMLQYIAPTLQFLIGVGIYGESASGTRLVGFALVWAGLIVFGLGLRRPRAVSQ